MQYFKEHRKVLSTWAMVLVTLIPIIMLLPRYLQGPYIPSVITGSAPDGNWSSSTWANSNNTILGTAANNTSDVWFTGSHGIITTVFFPSVDTPNTTKLEFLVGDSTHTWVDEEQYDTESQTQLYDSHSLAWITTNTAKNGLYKIQKIIYTDTMSNSVIQKVTFSASKGTLANYLLYAYYDPTIHNSGDRNSSFTSSYNGIPILVSTDASGDYASALAASLPFQQNSSGFANFNDGLTDLKGRANCGNDKCPDYTMNYGYNSALRGNTAQMGLLDLSSDGEINLTTAISITFTLVLSFGQNDGISRATNNAENALIGVLSDTSDELNAYISEWHQFDNRLKQPPAVGSSPQIQQARKQEYYLATNVLKASQDKQTGAFVVGLGNPWGDTRGDEDTGGYHMVWERDMYEISSALFEAGDIADASRAATWAFDQQQQPDGRFPEGSNADGDPYWTGTQMDEQAFPIMLAWKVGLTDYITYTKHIKPAADFILAHGPETPQDRWGGNSGYSPATIATEISGLLCAADIARLNNDVAAEERYTNAADNYQHNVINWTYTKTGPLGDGNYFEHIDDDGDPNNGNTITIANHGGNYDKRAIVDMSFLELVRQGVLPANAPEITSSLAIVDTTISEEIKGNRYWFRYNHDGYGEHPNGSDYDGSGDGQLWPLLSGERGIYTVADGGDGDPYLTAMMTSANSSGMIPEQIWGNSSSAGYVPGTPTKSMNPLNWAMAEYINLLFSSSEHKIADMIPLTYDRYVMHATESAKGGNTSNISSNAPGQ